MGNDHNTGMMVANAILCGIVFLCGALYYYTFGWPPQYEGRRPVKNKDPTTEKYHRLILTHKTK